MALAIGRQSVLGHLRDLPWVPLRHRRPTKIDVKREARSTEQMFGVSMDKKPKKPLSQRREAREGQRIGRLSRTRGNKELGTHGLGPMV